MTEVIQHLRRIPCFENVPETRMQVERLGGLTNMVYRARVEDEDFLLRIPGRGTEKYIDRVAEKHDAQVAADAGVSAKVLHFDEDSGVMLAEYIDGLTLNAECFQDHGSVQRSAEALRVLHGSDVPFKRRFEVFAQIDDYLGLIDRMQAQVPPGYEGVRDEASQVRRLLESKPVALAPCHCDPLAENFIDTGSRVFIVDWEYAGNNDPMWDLGDLSVEAQFDEDQDRILLESYFGGEPPPDQAGRMVIYKMLCDLLWTLWGVVQHANNNPADDFWIYSANRFDRCRRLMQDPQFARAISAL